VLVTLRLHLKDGSEQLLSREIADGDRATPAALVERMSDGDRVPLGDRRSCRLDEIERVELVPPPEPEAAPPWIEEGKPDAVELRDEDVAAARRQRHEER
jgi:hypothetical protein